VSITGTREIFQEKSTYKGGLHIIRFRPQIPGQYKFYLDLKNELYTTVNWNNTLEIPLLRHIRCKEETFANLKKALANEAASRAGTFKYKFVSSKNDPVLSREYYLFPTFVIDFWGSARKDFTAKEIDSFYHHMLVVLRNADNKAKSGLNQDLETDSWSKGAANKPKVIVLGFIDKTVTFGLDEYFTELDNFAQRYRTEYAEYGAQ